MATTNKQNALGRMWCATFGHQFVKIRNVTGHFKEYQCPVCRLEQTNNAKGERIFMTPELKDINETLMHLYQKRHPAV